jgi:hypothetical protein
VLRVGDELIPACEQYRDVDERAYRHADRQDNQEVRIAGDRRARRLQIDGNSGRINEELPGSGGSVSTRRSEASRFNVSILIARLKTLVAGPHAQQRGIQREVISDSNRSVSACECVRRFERVLQERQHLSAHHLARTPSIIGPGVDGRKVCVSLGHWSDHAVPAGVRFSSCSLLSARIVISVRTRPAISRWSVGMSR